MKPRSYDDCVTSGDDPRVRWEMHRLIGSLPDPAMPLPTLATPNYGSDKDGLVCGYLFGEGGPGRPVDAETASAWLRDRQPAGSFLWLHFNVANAAAERFMHQRLDLPESFHESLHDESGSTPVEQAGGHLVAVLHDVLFDFDFDASHVSTLCLCVERQLLVSARAKALRSIDKLRASMREGEKVRSPAELLAHLMRDQADVMVRIV